MDQKLHLLAVDHVLLDLRDVVGDIVDHEHVQVLGGLVEDLGEGLTGEEGHRGAVHPGVICRRGHGGQVVLALLGMDPGARQLPVVDLDVVPRHGALHLDERICGNLVPQAAAPRVDHDADLALLVYAHLLRDELVVDLLHDLDLRVVVPGSQGAHLWESALLRAGGHLRGVSIQHASELLAVLLVLGPGVALAQGPVDTELQHLLQVGVLARNDALRAYAHGDVVEKRLCQALLHRLHIGEEEVGPQQPHAAVDVEAHAARRDDRHGVVHVKSRGVSDRKPVPAVHIRHPDGMLHNPRQGSYVGNLLHRGQESAHILRLSAEALQLLNHELLQC
mmetsp:Transcript_111391/g.347208  ORF Transcript_111391/g.347208 Transcript_111391/m.347208 type:complete len:335 (+) Transcript_111391:524-1528(+)